jgi:hypothetical protein
MKLAEAVLNLNGLPDEAILFAERIDGHFTPESSVVVLTLDDNELKMPTTEIAALKAPGTEYFLEAFLVRDMVAELQDQGADTSLTLQRIIHYAEHDA